MPDNRNVLDRSMLRLPSTPRSAWPLCKLCDLDDWQRPAFAMLASDIMTRQPGHSFQHRKLWEFTQTVHALQCFGLWDTRAVGLSIAGGHERLLFYATHHIGRMVVTDIYGHGDFSNEQSEADRHFLVEPQQYAPYPYREERLKALYMDALDLKFESDFFDFTYSLSSIEHFGGYDQAVTALREMERVTKPGGIAVLVTECVLNGNNAMQFFLPDDLQRLVAATGLQLVEEVDWRLSDTTLGYLIDMATDDLNTVPHVNLIASGTMFTSVCLVLRKPAQPAGRAPLLGTDVNTVDAAVAVCARAA